MMRCEVFAAQSGFREDLLAGEEPELCFRVRAAGWKVWRLPDEMSLHDAAMTRFGQWWNGRYAGGTLWRKVRRCTVTLLNGTTWRRYAEQSFGGVALPVADIHADDAQFCLACTSAGLPPSSAAPGTSRRYPHRIESLACSLPGAGTIPRGPRRIQVLVVWLAQTPREAHRIQMIRRHETTTHELRHA